MQTIKQKIIDSFELGGMSTEKTTELTERLGKLIFQAVLVRALPLLSEEDMAEYEKMVNSKKGGEVIFEFLGEKVPDLENIIKEEIENLRAELAGEFAEMGV